MRQMYIILSVVGWAWLAVAAIVVPMRLRWLRRNRGPDNLTDSSNASESKPQAVDRP
jgi:hypothetical protein